MDWYLESSSRLINISIIFKVALQYHPRLIKSEVWYEMVGNPKVSGTDYLELFEKAGYKMFKDSKCQMPLDVRAALLKASVDVIMCK